jgi:hypothetical protein
MMFSVAPLGNFGNRMLALMMVPMPVSINAKLPDWGVNFDQGLHDRLLANRANLCWFDDGDATNLDDMAARIMASGAQAVVFHGYFQRFALLREAEFYRRIFTRHPLDIEPFAEDELVINIRAGDILCGKPYWYPLVPPLFYYRLIEHTGLRPVLLGQLDDCLYVNEIKRLLPGARLLPSAGALTDFNRLRHAKNLCITVSSFSWLAWLSTAARIHYPLLGFLHPLCLPKGWNGGGGTDLTPHGDARYLYHLFPILTAAPQLEYLRKTAMLNPISQPVPADFVAGLTAKAAQQPFRNAGAAQWHDDYLRKHPDAAWSIALGQYANAPEHYEGIGKANGYVLHPMQKFEWRLTRPNLARGKTATQSSTSEWSRQPTAEQDAAGAINGDFGESYNFHTAIEDGPWWRLDLGAAHSISEIWVFNRTDPPELKMRAARLIVDIGLTETSYRQAFQLTPPRPFGGADGDPLIIKLTTPQPARFIRLRLPVRECLHLAQVEVYGTLL